MKKHLAPTQIMLQINPKAHLTEDGRIEMEQNSVPLTFLERNPSAPCFFALGIFVLLFAVAAYVFTRRASKRTIKKGK